MFKLMFNDLATFDEINHTNIRHLSWRELGDLV